MLSIKSRLPSGYQELEYLESTGTQYIDTGFVPTLNTSRVCFDGYSTDRKSLFGVIQSTDRFGITGTLSGDNDIERFDYASQIYGSSILVGTRGVYELDKNIAKFNGTIVYTFNPSTAQITIPLYIMARNHDSGINDAATSRCYSCKIFDNNTLVRSFIPARRLSDSVLGLYDTVNSVFYVNQGTGTFVAGPDVPTRVFQPIVQRLPFAYQEVEYLQSTGTQYIDTGLTLELTTKSKVYLDQQYIGSNTSYFAYTGSNGNNTIYYEYNDNTLRLNTAYDITGNTRFNRLQFYTLTNIESGKRQAIYQNQLYTGSSSVTLSRSYWLFGMYDEQTNFRIKQKIFNCKIWIDDSLVRDFIPCVRRSDSVPGLYDVVNNVFYVNQGTGTFLTGNAVSTYRPFIIGDNQYYAPYSVEYSMRWQVPSLIDNHKNGYKPLSLVGFDGNTVVLNNQVKWSLLREQTIVNVIITKNDGVLNLNGTTNGFMNFVVSDDTETKIINGHYYLLYGGFTGGSSNFYLMDSDSQKSDYGDGVVYQCTTNGTLQSALRLRANTGIVFSNKKVRPRLVDLTQAFPFNTPTSLDDIRIKWLKAYLALNPSYNSGSLGSTIVRGVGSTGFNQWDEVFRFNGDNLVSSNYIKIENGTTYYFKLPKNGSLSLYDSNYIFIDNTSVTANTTKTFGSNVAYIKFEIGSYGTTYNHDICINISNSSLNGTYKPYVHNTINLPAPINLDGVNSVKNGFRITNTTYDFIRNAFDYTFTGSESWTTAGTNNTKQTSVLSGLIKSLSAGIKANAICEILEIDTYNNIYNGYNQKALGFSSTGLLITNENNIPSLTGTTITYELATPQVISIPRKHLGVVNLGTLDFTLGSDGLFYSTNLSNVVKRPLTNVGSDKISLLCSYPYNNVGLYHLPTSDNELAMAVNTQGNLYIQNKNYTNATTFRNAMKGQYLFFETANEVPDFIDSLYIQENGTIDTDYTDVAPDILTKMSIKK